jgi:phospholipid/cholesterol/gamma-HCH transport system substrate-binding protein
VGTRPPRLASIAAAVVFALSCFGFTLFIWISFGGNVPLRAEGYRFNAPFTSEAANLSTNAQVRISGVPVGRVVKLIRTGQRIQAVIQLDSRYAPIPSDAHAILRSKSLLGEEFVELTPGSPSAPKLKEGGSLKVANIAPVQQLDQVLSAFDKPTRTELKMFLRDFSAAFNHRGPDLNAALGNAEPTVTDLTTITRILDGQRPALKTLIHDGGTALQAVGGRQADLQSLVTSGDQVFSATAARNQQLTQTVSIFPTFLTQLRLTLHSIDGLNTDLRPVLADLRPAVPYLVPALRDAIPLADSIKATSIQLNPVITSANQGLPALTKVLDTARPLVDILYPAGRELVPVVDMIGAYKKEAVAALANVSSSAEGTLPRPNGGSIHYLRSLATVTNEIVQGAPQRPSTNRHNAYLKPGGLTDIFKNGPFSSDCRNVTNPPPIPLLGGAPPCYVGGAWTFQGKTRYYPNVTRDGP